MSHSGNFWKSDRWKLFLINFSSLLPLHGLLEQPIAFLTKFDDAGLARQIFFLGSLWPTVTTWWDSEALYRCVDLGEFHSLAVLAYRLHDVVWADCALSSHIWRVKDFDTLIPANQHFFVVHGTLSRTEFEEFLHVGAVWFKHLDLWKQDLLGVNGRPFCTRTVSVLKTCGISFAWVLVFGAAVGSHLSMHRYLRVECLVLPVWGISVLVCVLKRVLDQVVTSWWVCKNILELVKAKLIWVFCSILKHHFLLCHMQVLIRVYLDLTVWDISLSFGHDLPLISWVMMRPPLR